MTTPNDPHNSFHLDNRADAFIAALPLVVQAINARNEERARLLRSQSALSRMARRGRLGAVVAGLLRKPWRLLTPPR